MKANAEITPLSLQFLLSSLGTSQYLMYELMAVSAPALVIVLPTYVASGHRLSSVALTQLCFTQILLLPVWREIWQLNEQLIFLFAEYPLNWRRKIAIVKFAGSCTEICWNLEMTLRRLKWIYLNLWIYPSEIKMRIFRRRSTDTLADPQLTGLRFDQVSRYNTIIIWERKLGFGQYWIMKILLLSLSVLKWWKIFWIVVFS